MIYSGSSFFNRFSVPSVSQSSTETSEEGRLEGLSSVTSLSLSSRSSFDSLRLSPVAKLHYQLIGVFSVSRAQKLAESHIERMVSERKAQLVSGEEQGLAKVATENLRKEIDVLTEAFKQEHPLGRAVPWLVEDAVTHAFSKEEGVKQLIQNLEKVGSRYQERLAGYSENKRERKTDIVINGIYKNFVRRTVTGRENPELVKEVLLNYFKPEKTQEYIIHLLREEAQKIKEAHPKAVFSRQQAEGFIDAHAKNASPYLVTLHKEALMDMALREFNVPKHELSDSIQHLHIPSSSLFAMKKISKLISNLHSLEDEKDQEEIVSLFAQKLAPFKGAILEKFSSEIMLRSLCEKSQIPPHKLELDSYMNSVVIEVLDTIKQQFLQEGIDCSHPFLKKVFSFDFDGYIYNHVLFALFPSRRLEQIEKNMGRAMAAIGWGHETTSWANRAVLSPSSLESNINALCMHYPKKDHFFVSEIIRYRSSPEKSRLDFIKNTIKEFRFELALSLDTSFENRKKIIERLKEKFAWHPIFKDLLFLKSVLFDTVLLQGKACRLDKNMYGLKNTLIFCEGSSDAYALKNKLSDIDIEALKLQFPGAEISRSANEKCVIGQGCFGKVRFAKNIVTGCFVAVKKIRSQADARDEIKKYDLVGKGKYLIPLYNVAELKGKDHKLKSYLLMEYVNGVDGIDYLNSSMDNLNAAEKKKKLKSIAGHYLRSVAELHQKGVYHCDIKPDNFIHARNGDVRLIDYGYCSNKAYQRGGTTIRYASPEWLAGGRGYHGEKHDSFALGVSLLCWNGKLDSPDKTIQLTDSLGNRHLVSRNILPQFGFEPIFLGFNDVSGLKGETLDEVIMLLMAKNPRERITPKQALALPFFKTP